MEYLLAGAVVVLIVALIGLVGVRKKLAKEKKEHFETINEYLDQITEITELKNTNRAYKWANTKHKATIEELEKRIWLLKIALGSTREQRKELNEKIDESVPFAEKLLTMVKKGNMEEAKEVVKEFYKM